MGRSAIANLQRFLWLRLCVSVSLWRPLIRVRVSRGKTKTARLS